MKEITAESFSAFICQSTSPVNLGLICLNDFLMLPIVLVVLFPQQFLFYF